MVPRSGTALTLWYRANVDVETCGPDSWVLPRVSVPTLGIWSTGDIYLTEFQMVCSAGYVDSPWEYVRVEGASHWMMLDRPAHGGRREGW